ncbi:hypothetical protein J2858_001268 [Neorhizobium galegae]|nr:hypothetical protein [Neorhizobium galegae]
MPAGLAAVPITQMYLPEMAVTRPIDYMKTR